MHRASAQIDEASTEIVGPTNLLKHGRNRLHLLFVDLNTNHGRRAVDERELTVANSALANLDSGTVRELPWLGAQNETFHPYGQRSSRPDRGRRSWNHGDDGEQGQAAQRGSAHRPR